MENVGAPLDFARDKPAFFLRATHHSSLATGLLSSFNTSLTRTPGVGYLLQRADCCAHPKGIEWACPREPGGFCLAEPQGG